MVETFEVLEIRNSGGEPSGKYRMTRRADEPETPPIGLCKHEHNTPHEARDCQDVKQVMQANFPTKRNDPRDVEIARLNDLLSGCERYAVRMNHDLGHGLDRQNATAIVRLARQRDPSVKGNTDD